MTTCTLLSVLNVYLFIGQMFMVRSCYDSNSKMIRTVFGNTCSQGFSILLLLHKNWINNGDSKKVNNTLVHLTYCFWWRSGAFSLTKVGSFSIQLRDISSFRLYFFRVRFTIVHGIYMVTFMEETSDPLFQIENELNDEVIIQQKVVYFVLFLICLCFFLFLRCVFEDERKNVFNNFLSFAIHLYRMLTVGSLY
jgi:hypothetical protein